MPPRHQTTPTVPTAMVDVELARRRPGAAVAVLVGPGAEALWFGPGTDALPAGWRDWVEPTGKTGEVRTIPNGAASDSWW